MGKIQPYTGIILHTEAGKLDELVVPVKFLDKRLLATDIFQTDVRTTWEWPKKAVGQWAVDRTDLTQASDTLTGLELDLIRERSGTKDDINKVQNLTARSLRMMRSYYADNDEILASLQLLAADAHSQDGKLDEARKLEIAWAKLPEADRDEVSILTLEQFTAMRQAAEARKDALLQLESDVHDARIALHHLVARLWEDCANWYQAALAVFPAETLEGQKLRDNIPTEESKSSGKTG